MKKRSKVVSVLNLEAPLSNGRPAYVCAASGLVHFKNRFWIASDDELHLFHIDPVKDTYATPVRVFKGDLPLDLQKRKKKKKDFESLMVVAGQGLLALPSGSKSHRTQGILFDDKSGKSGCYQVDFSSLYETLSNYFERLNIEGAVVSSRSVYLAQRGNSDEGVNALIELDSDAFFQQLKKREFKKALLKSIHFLKLGEIGGVPLTPTDLCLGRSPSEILLSATAENTKDNYTDGACLGSRLFSYSEELGRVQQLKFAESVKVEGISYDQKSRTLTYVNDEDDVNVPSELRAVKL